MLRPRIIPCLLIQNGGLVKTTRFKIPKYVGDPINAVRIFNEKQADELMVLDIDASAKGITPNFDLISKLAAECRMPLCYGGGVSNLNDALRIVSAGVEKVSLSSAALANPSLVSEISNAVGSQSVVVVLDLVKRKTGLFSKGYGLCTLNATKLVSKDIGETVREMEDAGVGEIVFNFVDSDGVMQGYDLEEIRLLHNQTTVPTTYLGGAGTLGDIKKIVDEVGQVGAAAGSLFVFKGKYRAVLISYPSDSDKSDIFADYLGSGAN